MPRLVTADDLCVGLADVLAAQLPGIVTALGLGFPPVKTWTQPPTLDALRASAAAFPAGAVTSPGTVGRPEQHVGGIDATFRIVAGIYDRGPSADWSATSHRVRTWAALVRAVGIRNRTLGGVATGVTWVGESYRQITDKASARTIGGCSVEFDITAANVVDLDDIDPGPLPTVKTVHRAVTVRRTNQE